MNLDPFLPCFFSKTFRTYLWLLNLPNQKLGTELWGGCCKLIVNQEGLREMAKFLRMKYSNVLFLCWLKKETTHQAIVHQCYFRLDFVVLPPAPLWKLHPGGSWTLKRVTFFFVPYASIPGVRNGPTAGSWKIIPNWKGQSSEPKLHSFWVFSCKSTRGWEIVCDQVCVFWKVLATNKKTPPKFQKHRFSVKKHISKIFWKTWRLCVFTNPYRKGHVTASTSTWTIEV